MADYTIPTSVNAPNDRYNPKVMERKMRGQSDWAELVRHQQALADQMIQREKEKRVLQKMEQRETLDHLMNEKRAKERLEQQMKQQEYTDSLKKQHYYNQYVAQTKDDKSNLQKMFKDEYSREQWEKEQEHKKKMEHVKQVETRIVNDALDSLQHERTIKNQQKNEFIKSVDQLLHDKEMQKRQDYEKSLQNREEHNKLVNQYIHDTDMKDKNYKLYYQMLTNQQDEFRQVHDKKVTELQRNRDKHIDTFVDQNVAEAKRRAEMEEMRRRLKHESEVMDMTYNVKSKIKEHEYEHLREKLAYKDKVDNLMKKNQEMQEFNDQVKNYQTTLKSEYKNVLGDQMRANDENRRKLNSDMLDHEKNMLLKQFDGLIPGIKSSKAEEYLTPNIKTKKSLEYFGRSSTLGKDNEFARSYQPEGPNTQSPNNMSLNASHGPAFGQPNGRESPERQRGSMSEIKMPVQTEGDYSPIDHKRSSSNMIPGPKNGQGYVYHNPITNPLPYNVQNPYISKVGNGHGQGHGQSPSQSPKRNVLANVAQQSIIAGN